MSNEGIIFLEIPKTLTILMMLGLGFMHLSLEVLFQCIL